MSVQVNLFKLALITFVAVSLVVFGDTAGKLLTAQGVAPGLVAWSRFALAALLLPFVRIRKTDLLMLRDWRVLLVVQPGFGMSSGILFALLAGCCYGCYLAMTRLVAGAFPARLLLISQLMIGSIVLLPVGISEPLLSLNAASYFLICLSAIFSAAGNYLLVLANRWAEATLIAPLVYSQLISASVAGLVVFGDWPDGLSFVGLSLILVSGFGSLMLQKAK